MGIFHNIPPTPVVPWYFQQYIPNSTSSVTYVYSTDLAQVYNNIETSQFSNVIAYDNFVGTDGTELSSHTPSSGGLWTQHPVFTDSVVITNADRIRQNSTANTIYLESYMPPSADYAVGCNVYAFSLPSATGFNSGVCARFDPVNATGYTASYDPVKNPVWSLDRWNSGSKTNLGTVSQTISIDTEYELILTCYGSLISLSVNGTVIISVTDSSPITEIGQSGVFFGSVTVAATDLTGVHLDTWQLYDSIFIYYNNEIQLVIQLNSESSTCSEVVSPLLKIHDTDNPAELEAYLISNYLYQTDSGILTEQYTTSIFIFNTDSPSGTESILANLLDSEVPTAIEQSSSSWLLYNVDNPSGLESSILVILNYDIGSELEIQLSVIVSGVFYDTDSATASEAWISILMVSDAPSGHEFMLPIILATESDNPAATELVFPIMSSVVYSTDSIPEYEASIIFWLIYQADTATLLD